MFADRAVDGDVLLGDGIGFGPGRIAARERRQRAQHAQHTLDRPRQVDRGRPRLAQQVGTVLERAVARVVVHLQGDPVGRAGADQRRAAHPHLADRGEHRLRRIEARAQQPVRQRALVDDFDAVSRRQRADRAHRNAADLHRRLIPAVVMSAGASSPREAARQHATVHAGSRRC